MKFFIPILIAILLVSCNKKDVPMPITTGDLTSVQEVGHNYLFTGNSTYPKTSRIDLDQDGVEDIELYNSATPAGANGLMPVITLKTLHADIEMNVKRREDSMYIFYGFHSQPAPDGTMAYFHSEITSCEQESSVFSNIGAQTNTYLNPMEEGGILTPDHDFAQGTFNIVSAEEHSTQVEFFPDSTVYHIQRHKSSCYEFPESSIRFLGFRIAGDYGQKLGWIELEYLGENKLRIWDWAIQN